MSYSEPKSRTSHLAWQLWQLSTETFLVAFDYSCFLACVLERCFDCFVLSCCIKFFLWVVYIINTSQRNKIIKGNKDLISYFVYNNFNNALSSSQYPNGLKYADVTPVFKKDDKSDKSNYRPISILPNLSKVYERIMQNQIYPYLTSVWYATSIVRMRICTVAILQYFSSESWSQGD